MRDPKNGLERKTRTFRFRSHKECFVASEAVDWFIKHLKLDSREEAVAVGEALTHRGLIAHVLRSEPFQDNSSLHRIIDMDVSLLFAFPFNLILKLKLMVFGFFLFSSTKGWKFTRAMFRR